MAGGSLRSLFEHELHDLRTAEQQIIAALPEMISASQSRDLRRALEHHLERTRIHIERLDLLYKQCGITPVQTGPSGIDGVIRGGREMINAQSDADVRDAAIIDAAQHVEHYEIAGYGCARTFARQLGDNPSADLLQQTLDEEGDANKQLTRIAESGVNEAATAGAEIDRGRRMRLRYVDVDDLPSGDEFRDMPVRNNAGDDLGHVDGFVLDDSGRPYYLVVDSGGFLVGRRYMLPVGKADLRRPDRVFIADLDKDTLKRYPEFRTEAFMAMTDDEARRYEWRVLEAIDPRAARTSREEWSYDTFPLYREPDWFGRGTRPLAGTGASAGERGVSPTSRRVPISSEAERPEQERIAARENPASQDIPRERIRGSEKDRK